jgi:hypothetical protein
MKKIIALLILAAVAALPLAASAAEANVYADVMSAYVYRGIVGNDEAVFQPGLDVAGPLGLGYSLWANMNLTDVESPWYPDSSGKWGEVDLGLNWTCPAEGPVSLTVGATYFIYPQDSSVVLADDETGEPLVDADGNVRVSKAPADDGYELYAELAAGELPLAPSVRFCHDLANSEDWIVIFGVSHSIGLTDALSLDLGASLGYAGKYYVASNYGSGTGDALSHAQIDAVLTYALSETVSVGLKGSFSSLLDADLRDDVDAEGYYPETDVFFGGVTASYTF